MICIITARCGSKRIPKKNIRDFCGKPIIAYAIEVALKSELFEEVMVSTDCEEIAQISRQHGAAIPFLRSEENSGDFVGTADVLVEVLNSYDAIGRNFEFGCCIYPTTPLLSVDTLKRAYDLMIKEKYNVVFPVLEYSYPIQRSLRMVNNGQTKMLWPENYSKRSQDLESVFHDAGQFYWFNSQSIMEKKRLFTEHSGAVLVSELEAQDIDNESDWKLAELKYDIVSRRS